MHPETEEELKAISDRYFGNLPKEWSEEIEEMFKAFKARIMLETKVEGGSYSGVVNGHLNNR